jgi:hypothetical protein
VLIYRHSPITIKKAINLNPAKKYLSAVVWMVQVRKNTTNIEINFKRNVTQSQRIKKLFCLIGSTAFTERETKKAEMHLRFLCPAFLTLNLLGTFKTFLGSSVQFCSPLDSEFYREEFELFQYILSMHAIRIFNFISAYVFQINMMVKVCNRSYKNRSI